jgi:hypothetical protein
MIGRATTSESFSSLARYLEEGTGEADPAERVDWFDTRNLLATSPSETAREMADTAALSTRVQKPVLHLSVSFDPEDPVGRETMTWVADRLVEDLGLEGHQVLIVAHRDTHYPHLHLMVNRVSYWTGTAARLPFLYVQVERSLRHQERALGLREVPGWNYRLEGEGRTVPGPAEPRLSATGDDLKAIRGAFDTARSWDELEGALERRGFALEVERRSLRVTGLGGGSDAAARLVKGGALHRLEARFGTRWADREPASRETSLPEHTSSAHTFSTERGPGRPWQAALGRGERLRAEAALREEARRVEAVERERGRAAEPQDSSLRSERPERGPGRDREPGLEAGPSEPIGETEGGSGPPEREVDLSGPGASSTGQPAPDESLPPAVEEALSALERLRAEELRESRAGRWADRLIRAERELKGRLERLARLRDLDRSITAAFGRLYVDGAKAREAFDVFGAARGRREAWQRLTREPGRFGATRRRFFTRRLADEAAKGEAVRAASAFAGLSKADGLAPGAVRALSGAAALGRDEVRPGRGEVRPEADAQDAGRVPGYDRAPEAGDSPGRQAAADRPGRGAWEEVYRDPDLARSRFERAAEEVGQGPARRVLAGDPKTFGPVRPGGEAAVRRLAEAIGQEIGEPQVGAAIGGRTMGGKATRGGAASDAAIGGPAAGAARWQRETRRLSAEVRGLRAALDRHDATRASRSALAREAERRAAALSPAGRRLYVKEAKARPGLLARRSMALAVASKVAISIGVRIGREALGRDMSL